MVPAPELHLLQVRFESGCSSHWNQNSSMDRTMGCVWGGCAYIDQQPITQQYCPSRRLCAKPRDMFSCLNEMISTGVGGKEVKDTGYTLQGQQNPPNKDFSSERSMGLRGKSSATDEVKGFEHYLINIMPCFMPWSYGFLCIQDVPYSMSWWLPPFCMASL